jgi:hypothetical protein
VAGAPRAGRVGAALLVLAALSLGAAGWTAIRPIGLVLDGQRIEGQAVGILREPLGPLVRLRPIVAYRAGGAERRILGSGLVGYAAGSPVAVLRDRASGQAMLPGLLEGWAAPAGLALLALLLGLPGLRLWLRVPPEARIRVSTAGLRGRRARGETINEIRRRIARSDR